MSRPVISPSPSRSLSFAGLWVAGLLLGASPALSVQTVRAAAAEGSPPGARGAGPPGGASAEAAVPRRVVSLGGSVTETVYALGAEDRLVGVDESSVFPEAAEALPDVGYFRSLGVEGVLSLAPDLVLALEGSGPPTVLDRLRQAGVRVESIPADNTPEAALDKIRRVAGALGMREAGEALAREAEAQLARVRAVAAEVSRRPRTVFVWGRGGRTMQVSGRGTAAEAMLDLIEADNAVRGFEGYRPLTPEALISAEPEVLVIDEALLDRLGGVPGLSRDPALAATPAVRNGRVVPVHVLSFIGFGPRTGEVALDALRRVHGLVTDGPEPRP